MNIDSAEPTLHERQPDFKGCLSPDPMKLEGGEQTNNSVRHPLTDSGKTVMFREGGINECVHTASRFEEYAPIYQSTQIFWVNTIRDRIASPNRTLRFGKIENFLDLTQLHK
jgi:hypothetical protein